jgi:hypothetical protein
MATHHQGTPALNHAWRLIVTCAMHPISPILQLIVSQKKKFQLIEAFASIITSSPPGNMLEH